MNMVNNLIKGKGFNSDSLQKMTVLVVMFFMCIFFGVSSEYFFTVKNIMNIALQTAVTGITAYGMTVVIISQAVDLSIGSTIVLTSVIAAMMVAAGQPLWLAILSVLILGAFIGMCNGLMVSKMKLPPFIATLGMQMSLRGLALIVTDSKPVYINNQPLFKEISQYRLFDLIPLPVIYLIILGIIAYFILKRTVIGRHVFAVGSNEEAARLSGINTSKIRVFAYMFCGVMASCAAVVLTARVNSGQPTVGIGYEGNAIAAAVIGGASMTGGHGTITGTILGALVMGILMNGLNLLNVSQNWQTFATGMIVVFAVYIDKVQRARKMS